MMQIKTANQINIQIFPTQMNSTRQHRQTNSKSFILRSSRIKSKSSSAPIHTSDQQQSLRTIDNYLPSLENVGLLQTEPVLTQRQMREKEMEIKDRLNKLTLNLKSLQKQYKQNLKSGFQNKIKSYRLRAVMQRKLIKQAIAQTIFINQQQQIAEKHESAMRQKLFNQQTMQKQQQFKQRQLELLRRKVESEKQKLEWQRREREKEIERRNRWLRDRVKEEESKKDKKRNYLQFYRQEKIHKEEFDAKKEFLQKIVTNSKKLKSLKEELQITQERCLKLLIPIGQIKPIQNSSSLFVTI